MDNHCPTCGANTKKIKHSFSRGLATTFCKFVKKIMEKRENKIHLQSEMNFTHNEYNNFQKLRYFGIIEKTGEAGIWKVSQSGREFIDNKRSIPHYVHTFRNVVISEVLQTIPQIYIDQVRSVAPNDYWQKDWSTIN